MLPSDLETGAWPGDKERGAGQARDPQKDREREVSLEGNDGLELQRRP
ncbi:hypothetical protein PJ267_06500 [Arthrobacter sp. OVS8]|nr:hypothetical protein PJ267_10695 [Arthrobacter sp. OVS8]WCI07921.1 hypothetical protein PJ267_15025 [Arthrobacter sp. OVS8]WCI09348.1 hypothetical protein PJ267_06500 [Arthrobacter sp. OVS8]